MRERNKERKLEKRKELVLVISSYILRINIRGANILPLKLRLGVSRLKIGYTP
jgi:hypothetical protein